MACSIHDFIDKNCNIFVLKVKKLDEEVIDNGREGEREKGFVQEGRISNFGQFSFSAGSS